MKYSTTQQRLIFQWFNLLNWKYLQLHVNKQDREKGRLNTTHSQWYVSVCQTGFHQRYRPEGWGVSPRSLTAGKYRVLTLHCKHVCIWRATVQWLLDKAKEWSSVSEIKKLSPNTWQHVSVAWLPYTQDFPGLCTFQAFHLLLIYPESPWSWNLPTKTLGQNLLSNPTLKWNTTELH